MGDVKIAPKVIGVAVIGIGRIGKVHVSNILRLPGVQLLYIVDVCKNLAEEYIEEYGLTTKALHTDEIDVALDDARVDAVIVCCPTQAHEVHTKAALNKGKAVMCEKPLSFSLDAIVECYGMAENQKQPLFCAFNRRFDPQITSIWSQIPEVVGKIKVVKTTSRDHPMSSIEYLRISGGIVLDTCIHDIDHINWTVGQIPETIYAIGQAHFDDVGQIGDFDQIFITMKYPGGAMGHVDTGREARYGHDQRYEVFGEKGMLTGNNMTATVSVAHTPSGSKFPPILDSCIERYDKAYRAEMIHFLNVVRGIENLKVTGTEVVWTTLCCHAANESLSSGNPVNVADFVQKRFPKILSSIGQWN